MNYNKLPTYDEYMRDEGLRLQQRFINKEDLSPYELLGCLSSRLGVSLQTAIKHHKMVLVAEGICKENE